MRRLVPVEDVCVKVREVLHEQSGEQRCSQRRRFETLRVLDDVWQRLEVEEFYLSDNSHRSAEGRQAGDQCEISESPSGVASMEFAKAKASMEKERCLDV